MIHSSDLLRRNEDAPAGSALRSSRYRRSNDISDWRTSNRSKCLWRARIKRFDPTLGALRRGAEEGCRVTYRPGGKLPRRRRRGAGRPAATGPNALAVADPLWVAHSSTGRRVRSVSSAASNSLVLPAKGGSTSKIRTSALLVGLARSCLSAIRRAKSQLLADSQEGQKSWRGVIWGVIFLLGGILESAFL